MTVGLGLSPLKFPMRLLVCGDRDWTDAELIYRTLARHKNKIAVVIEGEQRGADIKARAAAEVLGIPVEHYPAAWAQCGRAAGALRNRKMLEVGKPDFVLAFHDDIWNSNGTANMLLIAAHLPRALVSHKDPECFDRVLEELANGS